MNTEISGQAVVVASTKLVDVATLSLRRTPGPTITKAQGGLRLALGRAVFVGERRYRRSDALDEELTNDEDPIESRDADAQLVAHTNLLRRLHLVAVHPYMPCAACCRRGRARLVDTDRPEPAVHTCGIHQELVLRRDTSAPAMIRPWPIT